MKPISLIHSCTAGLFLSLASPVLGDAPDTIYFNGAIHTMIRDGDRVEALAVTNGKISAVGTKDNLLAIKDSETKLVDLAGKSLMPGFIDDCPCAARRRFARTVLPTPAQAS